MSAAAPALKIPPAPAVMTGARLLVSSLERMGVEVVFGYPGGAIMPIYDALTGSSLKHILVRHEQGAALAARQGLQHAGLFVVEADDIGHAGHHRDAQRLAEQKRQHPGGLAAFGPAAGEDDVRIPAA